jgi:hypothetical protein
MFNDGFWCFVSISGTWDLWSVALSNLVSKTADPREVLMELCYQHENEVAIEAFNKFVRKALFLNFW